jgi:hypothetical protein
VKTALLLVVLASLVWLIDTRTLADRSSESDDGVASNLSGFTSERVSSTDDSKVSTLSEANDKTGVAPDSKYGTPEWFRPNEEYNDEQSFLFVQTEGPCTNKDEARKALIDACAERIRSILRLWHGESAGQEISVTESEIIEHLIFQNRLEVREYKDEYTEQLCLKFGIDDGFYRGYAQLHLNDAFRGRIEQRWKTAVTERRLLLSALVGGGVFAGLTLVFGYLKMNALTRGFYSRRLQTAVVASAAIVALLLTWLGQHLQVL